jgi:hypothetical protein
MCYDIIYSNISYFACMCFVFICVCVMFCISMCMAKCDIRMRNSKFVVLFVLYCRVLINDKVCRINNGFEFKRRFHVKTGCEGIGGILCYEHTDCAIGEWFVKLNKRMKKLVEAIHHQKRFGWSLFALELIGWDDKDWKDYGEKCAQEINWFESLNLLAMV